MPQLVEVPDFGTVEFPDDMTPEAIGEVLSSQTASTSTSIPEPIRQPDPFWQPPIEPARSVEELTQRNIAGERALGIQTAVPRVTGPMEPTVPLSKIVPSAQTPSTISERALGMVIPGGAVHTALYGPESTVAQIRGLARGALAIPEFMTSPVGAVTGIAASLGKPIQMLVALGFSVDMAKSLAEQAANTITNWGSLSDAEKSDAVVSMAQTLGLTGLTAMHGGKLAAEMVPKRPIEPAAVPPVIPPPIPKTPPPLPRLAETPDVETALRQPEGAESLTEIDKEIARAKQLSPAARGPQITEAPAEPPLQPKPEVAAGEKIVAVASRLGDAIETGPIHVDAEQKLRSKLGLSMDDPRVENIEHGFLTDTGRFVGREEGFEIAEKSNQLKKNVEDPGFLGKEDLKKGFDKKSIVAPETTIPEPPKEMFHGTRAAGTLKIGQGKNLNTQGLWLSDSESKASEFSEGRPSDEGIASVRSVEFTPSKTKKVYGPDLKHTDANDLIKQGYDSVYVPDTGFWIALKESAFKEKQPTQPKAEYAVPIESPNALYVEPTPRSSETMGEGIPPEGKEPTRTQAETGAKTEAPVAQPPSKPAEGGGGEPLVLGVKAPENGSVTRYAPATGKKGTFIKWNGQWFKSKNGVTVGKPLDPNLTLTQALDKQLAKKQPTTPPTYGVGDVPIAREMIETMGKSLSEMRAKVSDVRYGKPGEILFDFEGKTYSAPEPTDVMPAKDTKGTNEEASRSWALKQILDGKAKERTTPSTAGGEGKPIGMGGAVPEEFQRVGGSPAATKFRMMDKARVARGLEPLLKPESVKDQAVLDRAMAEYDNNPAGAEKLADSLIENPRPIQDWENDYLLLRWIDTRDQFYKSAKEAQIADADGRVADLAAANGRTAEWSAAMTKLEKALRVGGSETGRALRARRVLIAEDFTLAGLETQRRAQLQSVGVSGAELERQMAEGRAELEKMASEYKATADSLKVDLENRNQRISRLEAQLELNRIKAEAAKQPYDKRVLDYAESIVKRMETAADAASTRLKERLSRMSAGVDPLILSDAAIVGAAKIARLGLNLAKFTDVMVAEYSEKMRPFMAEIWDASNKLLEANLKPENKKVKTAIKRNATITERKVDAEIKIRTKIQEGKRNELTPVLRKYERILVEQGMDKLDPIVDEVHKFVQQIDPTMTREMTMDALSGYGDFKPLSKATVDVVVRDLHQQGQLVAKLRDMASGVSPSRSGFERQPPSDIARWLTKQVEEAKKKGGYQVTNPATQLRTAMDAVHKRFQDQIADLEHQISTRQKIVRDKTALVYDEKANQLKARRDELKEIFDEVFPKEPLTDAQRLERWNRQIDRRIADYEERIINRDFSKREKRPPPPLGPNELAKMDRLLQLKEGFNDLLLHDRYKNMKLHQKAWVAAKESLNIPRNVMASADLSAVLRQGGILAGSHPILAAKGIVPMLKGFASERLAGISDQEILNRPNAKSGRYAQAKLYMAPLRSTTLSAMEEQIMSRFVHSKLFKWTGVRASNRAFITFLNRIRADSFDLMVENLERKGTPLTDAELKAIGNYINIATGRGDMGRFAAGSEALATAFFAPRLVTSRFQFLAGKPFMRGTAQTRTLIAKEYARSLAALSVVLSLGALAGATVETDPRSSDFGKMRFGNVRLDPMAGLSQTAVLLSRIFSGKQKQMSGKLVPLRGPEVKYGMGNTADVLFRFLRAKFSPVVGTALNIASGENVVGEPVTAVNEIKNLLTPLSFQEVLNVMKEQGIATGTAMTILSLFGMGLQYFEPKKTASKAALIP